MPTISQQLNQLSQDRENLVDNLETMGIEDLTGDETFTQLVPQVLNISGGQYIQYDVIPEASSELNNSIIQYVGATGNGYTNGYFYKCQESATPGTYEWININVQTEPESEHIQYSTMPEASASNLGKIVEYIGATGTYVNGYFYQCISDGAGTPTYSWSPIQIQDEAIYDIRPKRIDASGNNTGYKQYSLTSDEINTYNSLCLRYGRFIPIKIRAYCSNTLAQTAGGVYDVTYRFRIAENDVNYYFDGGVRINTGTNQFISKICNFRTDELSLNSKPVGQLTSLTLLCEVRQFLTTENSAGYTPSGDYNPATKKYVDDRNPVTSVTGVLTSGTQATINYPDGYTKDNCIVLSIASDYNNNDNYNDYYGDPNFEVTFCANLGSSNIKVSAQYLGTPDTNNRNVKVWLMKVS